MLIRTIGKLFRLSLLATFAWLMIILFPLLVTWIYTLPRNHSVANSPRKPVAIVFGAGLLRDGSAGPVLRERVSTASRLYLSGKVDILLMSGDNSSLYYNEPAAMRSYALSLGVPDEAIVLDYAGRRTYDTCYRARAIFGVEEAILVTQQFHLSRAVYTCNMLGVSAIGVPAFVPGYNPARLAYWYFRETFATMAALWDVHVAQPLPILGKPEPIGLLEAQ